MKKFIKNFRQYIYSSELRVFDTFVSFLIFIVLISFLGFMILKVIGILNDTINLNFKHMIHDVIYFIVLVKVYKILISYIRVHHISVKYILEISIIAPMIEVIFIVDQRPWWVTVIFIIFSFLSLSLYMIFYEKIQKMK